jgi:hypothetical protein
MTSILNTAKLIEIYVGCDDFLKKLNEHQIANGFETERFDGIMTESEMMSIVIFYHSGEPSLIRHEML